MSNQIFAISWGKVNKSGVVLEERGKYRAIVYEGAKKTDFGLFSRFSVARDKVQDFVEKVDTAKEKK